MALSRTRRDAGAAPRSTAVEMSQLLIRAIALEHLVVTSRAELSDRQREMEREMAFYLPPETELTERPMAAHRAARMIELVERAARFRDSAAHAGSAGE
jgi:hypothetical protein